MSRLILLDWNWNQSRLKLNQSRLKLEWFLWRRLQTDSPRLKTESVQTENGISPDWKWNQSRLKTNQSRLELELLSAQNQFRRIEMESVQTESNPDWNETGITFLAMSPDWFFPDWLFSIPELEWNWSSFHAVASRINSVWIFQF